MAGVQQESERKVQERGLQTRQRVLEAAIDCLVELGYARTTVAAVQARAGVSTGRLLHHFGSKEQLLAATVQHLGEVRLAAIEARLSAVPGGGGDDIDVAVQLVWDVLAGRVFNAWVEVWVAARTDETLWAVLEPVEAELVQQARRLAAQAFGRHSRHPRFVELLDLLSSSIHGHYLWQQFEPRRRRQPANLASLKRVAHDILEGD